MNFEKLLGEKTFKCWEQWRCCELIWAIIYNIVTRLLKYHLQSSAIFFFFTYKFQFSSKLVLVHSHSFEQKFTIFLLSVVSNQTIHSFYSIFFFFIFYLPPETHFYHVLSTILSFDRVLCFAGCPNVEKAPSCLFYIFIYFFLL